MSIQKELEDDYVSPYPELSDEADEFYLGSRVDLENCSPHGYYCRIKLPKQPETRTFRLDLNKLESFRLL